MKRTMEPETTKQILSLACLTMIGMVMLWVIGCLLTAFPLTYILNHFTSIHITYWGMVFLLLLLSWFFSFIRSMVK